MITALVTRPQPDADELAQLLRIRHIYPIIDPLFTVQFSAAPPELKTYQAVFATSRNGMRALQHCGADKKFFHLPFFAVGAETEEAARAAGFAQTYRAEQSALSLGALVKEKCGAGAGPLLYLAGEARKIGLENELAAAGFKIDVWNAYAMHPAPRLRAETEAALAAGKIDAVLLFSERASRHFLDLTAHHSPEALAKPSYFCLSEQVALPLRRKERRIFVADKPSLLSLVEQLSPKN